MNAADIGLGDTIISKYHRILATLRDVMSWARTVRPCIAVKRCSGFCFKHSKATIRETNNAVNICRHKRILLAAEHAGLANAGTASFFTEGVDDHIFHAMTIFEDKVFTFVLRFWDRIFNAALRVIQRTRCIVRTNAKNNGSIRAASTQHTQRLPLLTGNKGSIYYYLCVGPFNTRFGSYANSQHFCQIGNLLRFHCINGIYRFFRIERIGQHKAKHIGGQGAALQCCFQPIHTSAYSMKHFVESGRMTTVNVVRHLLRQIVVKIHDLCLLFFLVFFCNSYGICSEIFSEIFTDAFAFLESIDIR